MEKVLVIEDDDSVREVLCAVLNEDGYSIESVASGEQGLSALQAGEYACVICDLKLPRMNGIDFLMKCRELDAQIPFLLTTAYGNTDIAVEAMKRGANDYISKPFEPDTLRKLIRETIEKRRLILRDNSLARRERKFLTNHGPTEKILRAARKVAAVDSSVLILGESGTGKELLARFIHSNSPRHDKPFIALNCGATPPDLLESEFFGHEAGAFTGATQSRPGVFELARNGTIFLDEIGEMPLALQVKLLRALQERELKRVGGTKTIRINARVVAATNHNIDHALAAGVLREDLYYRVAVVTFTLPPLRERPGDIDLLASSFLRSFCGQAQKELTLSADAMALLKKYHWPGNGRELENVIERAVILAEKVIEPKHLGIELNLELSGGDEANHTLTEIAARAARRAEIAMIRRTLERTAGNKTKAAKALGVSYKTLLNKVREYELEMI